MQLDNLTLACLVQELRPLLEGAYVNKVSEIKSGTLKIKLHTKRGSKDIIITPSSIFATNYSVAARHGKTNFAVALKKELYNKRIVGIEQHEMDRVVAIKFLEHTLVLEFIGDGNKVLAGKDGIALACERNEKWADRETRKGVPYKFPKQQGANPATIDAAALGAIFKNSKRDAFREFLGSVNVSPLIAEEIFLGAGILKSAPASSLGPKELEALCSQAGFFYSLKKPAAPSAYKGFIFPFPLQHLKETPVQGTSLNSMLDEQFAAAFGEPEKEIAKKGKQPKKDRAASHEFMQKQQEESRKKFEAKAQENQRRGELIYENYTQIEELQKAVLAAISKGLKEKQIMEKIEGAAQKGNSAARLLKKVDVGARKIEVEL